MLRAMHDKLSSQKEKLAAEIGNNDNAEGIKGSNHRKQEESHCDKGKTNLHGHKIACL